MDKQFESFFFGLTSLIYSVAAFSLGKEIYMKEETKTKEIKQQRTQWVQRWKGSKRKRQNKS